MAEHNLASYRYGPTLRASSYYRAFYAHHHPAFLVDGRKKPLKVEKWASAEGDLAPWVEVRFREPHALKRVVIQHAGAREPDALTSRAYQLSCVRDTGAVVELTVRDNVLDVAEHALLCADARALRVSWQRRPDDELVRIYELEVWGQ